ncbi:MAG: TolB family protein, partial [Bryobacteraceae bacterium]
MKKLALVLWTACAAGAAEKRPMTFLDVMHVRAVEGGELSRDGKRFAYLVRELDWKAGKRFSDVYVTSAAGGPSRRLTFSAGKMETDPTFSPDGEWLAFVSDREGSNQLYLMPLSGGEPRKISDPPGTVASFAFSRDGKWLAYRSGRGETGQIHLYDMAKDKAEALTKHATGVGTFAWAPDSSRIYFTAADERDEWERRRMDLKFDVRLVDAPRQAEHLWEVALDKNEKRLTSGDFSVRR